MGFGDIFRHKAAGEQDGIFGGGAFAMFQSARRPAHERFDLSRRSRRREEMKTLSYARES